MPPPGQSAMAHWAGGACTKLGHLAEVGQVTCFIA